jgi:hypothetical protein
MNLKAVNVLSRCLPILGHLRFEKTLPFDRSANSLKSTEKTIAARLIFSTDIEYKIPYEVVI